MSFLIFDIDRSLASIGGIKTAESISSIKPIQITNGLSEVTAVLSKLFIKEQTGYEHPLLQDKIRQTVFKPSSTAQSYKLEGIVIDTVIDTISHLFRIDMRLLESKNKSERMELFDWTKLDRTYNQFISSLIQLPVWAVVNAHITYDKNDLGQFLFNPLLKGATKDWIGEYFDCIFFTRIKNSNNQVQYLWQTKPDSQRYAKDRLDILEVFIPQDFGFVINLYKRNGIAHPKILVIGESGTGKTRAIKTLENKGHYQVSNRDNGKGSVKLFN